MALARWQHLTMVTLLLGGIFFVTRGDSCEGDAPPSTVVAPASPGTPLDQLSGVVVRINFVDTSGVPVVGIKGTLSWNPDTAKLAGTTSDGITDSNGQITFQGFGDADFGTWNVGVDVPGNYYQSISRARLSTNPNPRTYQVKVLPSPSPSPSETPSPSPSESPSPSATATDTPPIVILPDTGGGGGGGGVAATPTATAVAGSGPVSSQVIITAGSPGATDPAATFP